MRHLFDARLMASCLPGCESLEALGRQIATAPSSSVALAGIKARFDLQVESDRARAARRACDHARRGRRPRQHAAGRRAGVTPDAVAERHAASSYRSEVRSPAGSAASRSA